MAWNPVRRVLSYIQGDTTIYGKSFSKIGINARTIKKIPTRSRRYGVGKEIGGAIYLYRHYEALLGDPVRQAKAILPGGYEYTVVKFNRVSGAVSFIQSPDFDTAPEPMVGSSWTVSPQGKTTLREQPGDPFVYHHKWLFVADDYVGFDVAQSQQRTLSWIFLEGIDRKRIGRKSTWANLMHLLTSYSFLLGSLSHS